MKDMIIFTVNASSDTATLATAILHEARQIIIFEWKVNVLNEHVIYITHIELYAN